jgi:hypothetical protein
LYFGDSHATRFIDGNPFDNTFTNLTQFYHFLRLSFDAVSALPFSTNQEVGAHHRHIFLQISKFVKLLIPLLGASI